VKEETRYRVTGTLFLLALAVICLPMLLDGAGLPARDLPPMPMGNQLPEIRVTEPPPESDFVARVEKLREQVDEEGYTTATGTRFGEPVLVPANARTDVWAVQVASFGAAANAEEFRARLRSDGYEAFISNARSPDGKVMSRVAVGPLLERGRAQTLQEELSGRYSVKAQLMDFSN
jgi:DedD protein